MASLKRNKPENDDDSQENTTKKKRKIDDAAPHIYANSNLSERKMTEAVSMIDSFLQSSQYSASEQSQLIERLECIASNAKSRLKEIAWRTKYGSLSKCASFKGRGMIKG